MGYQVAVPDGLDPRLAAIVGEILGGPLAWPPVPPLSGEVDPAWVVRWSPSPEPWTVHTLTPWAVQELARLGSPVHLIDLTPMQRADARRLLPWPGALEILPLQRWAPIDDPGPEPREKGERILERMKRHFRRQPFDWLAEYDESTPTQDLLEAALDIWSSSRKRRRIASGGLGEGAAPDPDEVRRLMRSAAEAAEERERAARRGRRRTGRRCR